MVRSNDNNNRSLLKSRTHPLRISSRSKHKNAKSQDKKRQEMVKKDDSTYNESSDVDSFLDVHSITLTDHNTSGITEAMSKAIMWNHGFGTREPVLRAYDRSKAFYEPSAFALRMSDALKTLEQKGVGKIGKFEGIKHGNVVALYGHGVNRFLRLCDEKVDGRGWTRRGSELPRYWGAERFLILEVKESLLSTQSALTDTFNLMVILWEAKAENQYSKYLMTIKANSKGYVYLDNNDNADINGKPDQFFQVVVISDAFSAKSK
eukprot:scaffold945_cov170-Amphora_coffeaeformis.AAC.23